MEESKDLVTLPHGEPTALAKPESTYRPYLEPEDQSQLGLREYWRVIKKHKWLIMTMVVTVTTTMTIWTFRQIPLFKASVTLQLDPPALNVLTFKDVVSENASPDPSSNLETQVRILKSRTLARSVVQQLDLPYDPAFVRAKKDKAGSTDATNQPAHSVNPRSDLPLPPDEEAVVTNLVDPVLRDLDVKAIRGSRILEVTYVSAKPDLATKIANAFANAFIDYNLESKFVATQRASEWLMKQSVDLKAKLEKSETALGEYAQKNDIVYLDDRQNIVTQQLSSLAAAVTQAQNDRIRVESLYRQVHSPSAAEITLFRESSLIQALNAKLASLSEQYAELSTKFEPDWPDLTKLRAQIDQVKEQIGAEKKRIIKTVDTDYASALSREKSFRQALERQKVETSELNEKQIHYNILKREVETNRQLYDGLLQRLKEAGVSAGLKASNVRILDPAEIPKAPFSPNKARNILLGLIAGIMSGLGLAFLIEFLDTRLKSPDQIEHLLRLPSLAMVPALYPTQPRKLLTSGLGLTGANGEPAEKRHTIDLISFTEVKSIVSEAYRALRTSILLSTNSRPPKTILVTSPGPGEGKTTTATNLGITLAQLGAKVLIIDSDMRRPRIHRIFEVPKENPGFSAYLSGSSKLVPLIVETQVPNLFCIPAGVAPPNPSELIGSEIMRQTLELLRDHFDHVILDSPPVMSVTDATILSTLVEGVVLVIHGNATHRDAATRAAQRLRDVGAHIFGTVLNNVDIRSADYDYYYHQYYFYHYYTDEEKKKKSVY